ncbi:hypothetical protein QYE76_040111 [Lolium multiflorum]|uniref:CCHC-type domain-containing protein n=1 Tax=Lolium multiflorum TaxID=4521 RepID=A0AAD8WV52_LOLMU|nr:hypothetical protein QYE76_040111 [Lolium multiflorum]
MENYSLLMGDIGVDGDGGGVDGDAFRGTPSRQGAGTETPVPQILASRWRRLWKIMASPINVNQFLEKEKLKSNGSNFTDWFRHLPELFAMLKSAEVEIKKEHQVLMVNKITSFKKQGKSKGKFKKGGKKAATPPVKPKNGPKPDAKCYYCKEKGH